MRNPEGPEQDSKPCALGSTPCAPAKIEYGTHSYGLSPGALVRQLTLKDVGG